MLAFPLWKTQPTELSLKKTKITFHQIPKEGISKQKRLQWWVELPEPKRNAVSFRKQEVKLKKKSVYQHDSHSTEQVTCSFLGCLCTVHQLSSRASAGHIRPCQRKLSRSPDSLYYSCMQSCQWHHGNGHSGHSCQLQKSTRWCSRTSGHLLWTPASINNGTSLHQQEQAKGSQHTKWRAPMETQTECTCVCSCWRQTPSWR